MNARTIMSAKGQVVIPKDVRDRLGLVPGGALDVTEMAGGVFLKAISRHPKRTFEEVEAELRALIQYDGPRVSIEDMRLTDDELVILTADSGDRAGN
jgi:AbrB family looped-hinge helix DNA binding protein